MFVKWCFGVLVFSLTLFGVVSQQQLGVANQVIVLKFQNPKLTSQQTARTVANLKQQLQGLGAKNIKVLFKGNGQLKFKYYSKINAVSIKKTLANAAIFNAIGTNEKNKKKSFEDTYVGCNFDVYEIEQSPNSGWDLNGTTVIVLDVKSDRYINSNQLLLSSYQYTCQYSCTSVAYKIGKDIAIHISNTLHAIPEVRAGPHC